ncbi:MAG: hypothetical protein HRU19_22430 [Pseudobacteriovorax sp.]|nr:hypothetical protein [Pseudobacteriovorax sp.]
MKMRIVGIEILVVAFMVLLASCSNDDNSEGSQVKSGLTGTECAIENATAFDQICMDGIWQNNLYNFEAEESFVRSLGQGTELVCTRFYNSYDFNNRLTLKLGSDSRIARVQFETTFTGWDEPNDSYHNINNSYDIIRYESGLGVISDVDFRLKGSVGLFVNQGKGKIEVRACDRYYGDDVCRISTATFDIARHCTIR